jgi:hypothetical protein
MFLHSNFPSLSCLIAFPPSYVLTSQDTGLFFKRRSCSGAQSIPSHCGYWQTVLLPLMNDVIYNLWRLGSPIIAFSWSPWALSGRLRSPSGWWMTCWKYPWLPRYLRRMQLHRGCTLQEQIRTWDSSVTVPSQVPKRRQNRPVVMLLWWSISFLNGCPCLWDIIWCSIPGTPKCTRGVHTQLMIPTRQVSSPLTYFRFVGPRIPRTKVKGSHVTWGDQAIRLAHEVTNSTQACLVGASALFQHARRRSPSQAPPRGCGGVHNSEFRASAPTLRLDKAR